MSAAVTEDTPVLHLFEGVGIEMEYMIVDADTLSVLPVSDQLLKAVAGEYVMEVERGELAWSNELALHVIELKCNGPAPAIDSLSAPFQRDVQHINALLEPLNGRLMPTAMHPWMDPARETQLWPHDDSPIYTAFDRIFGCQGHGWSNLQSVHINLPFADDREFARLHAAIRLVLPVLPALAASSPVIERRVTGLLDTRLDVYRNNARRIPSVSGQVIPEPVFSRRDYEAGILQPIYRDLEPHDPGGVLLYEWVNARGAIARFDRNTIEIRVLDIQECPRTDLAYAALITQLVRALVEETFSTLRAQQDWQVAPLYRIFQDCVVHGESAIIRDRDFLAILGFPERGSCRAGDLWQHLMETLYRDDASAAAPWRDSWDVYLAHGTLARRILRALDDAPDAGQVTDVYRRLCEALQAGRAFIA